MRPPLLNLVIIEEQNSFQKFNFIFDHQSLDFKEYYSKQIGKFDFVVAP